MDAQSSSRELQSRFIAVERTGLSKLRIWSGRTLFALLVLFLLMDGAMKLFKPPVVVEATTVRLGYPESTIIGISVVVLFCTVLYVIPRTAVLGAILLTAHLGGAVASNVRAGTPIFNIAFPCLFGVVSRDTVFPIILAYWFWAWAVIA